MKNENLIKILYDCAATCDWCADACLEEENIKMMVECIRLDRICAATCKATALALTSNSQAGGVAELIKACKTICEQCGNECAQHEMDHCKKCAEACRRCVEACNQYAA